MSKKKSEESNQQQVASAEPVKNREESSVDMDALEALKTDLEAMESKAGEHWDQFLRTQAELENLRKRAERDLEHAHKFTLERFVRELLPVKDSLELGLGSAPTNGEEIEKIREGMELTLKILSQAFEKFGIKEINPVGQLFNPESHQAMTTQLNTDNPPNTVLSVMQKGYLLNDRVLRPALVVVSKAEQQ